MNALQRFFRTRYRIRGDAYCGYEAQFKRWHDLCWHECFHCNTKLTLEAARKLCDQHNNIGRVLEYYDPVVR
jgi:hypothetical protein